MSLEFLSRHSPNSLAGSAASLERMLHGQAVRAGEKEIQRRWYIALGVGLLFVVLMAMFGLGEHAWLPVLAVVELVVGAAWIGRRHIIRPLSRKANRLAAALRSIFSLPPLAVSPPLTASFVSALLAPTTPPPRSVLLRSKEINAPRGNSAKCTRMS